MPEHRRARWLILGLLAAVVLVATLSLLVGSASVPPGEVIARMAAALRGRATFDATDRILLLTRFPRIVMAALVGATLASAGLSAQTLFRNPLASPYVLGVASGSALGAVVGILVVGKASPNAGFVLVPALSLVGGLTATAVVLAVARRGNSASHGLLLAGIAIGTLCSALTSAALFIAGERLEMLVFWLMGGMWRAGWRDVLVMGPVAAACLVTLLALAPAMNVALVGERSARDLGVHVQRLQLLLVLVISVGTAMAVSLTGMIGFVGLVVPHLLRLTIGGDHRYLVPATALGGAVLLTSADTLARTVAAPIEVPVGIVTAILGTPIFLWLLQRRSAGGLTT